MATESQRGASVLIVDPDDAIRCLVTVVLEQAGFHTACACDLDSAAALMQTSRFSVILRDLNLAPTASRGALQKLTATAPEQLHRTVVMTTAAARAEKSLRGTVFAIVSKPFDIPRLVDAIRACARASDAAQQLDSVEQFVRAIPSLEEMLADPVGCQREAALRAEMRRTLGVLSTTLREAAFAEGSRTRAAVFRGASTVAARLAAAHLAKRGRRRHDH